MQKEKPAMPPLPLKSGSTMTWWLALILTTLIRSWNQTRSSMPRIKGKSLSWLPTNPYASMGTMPPLALSMNSMAVFTTAAPIVFRTAMSRSGCMMIRPWMTCTIALRLRTKPVSKLGTLSKPCGSASGLASRASAMISKASWMV